MEDKETMTTLPNEPLVTGDLPPLKRRKRHNRIVPPLYNLDGNGNQIYTKNADGNEVYVDTPDKTRLFAVRNGKPYYAKMANGDKYYPKIAGDDICMETASECQYATLSNGDEFYPKNIFNDEFPVKFQNNIVYAKTKVGDEFYPKMSNGDEKAHDNKYIFNPDHTVKYPLDQSGLPIYPIDSNTSDAYYLKDKRGNFCFAKGKYGNQFYAKKANGDQFYPDDTMFAKTFDGNPVYPLTHQGKIVFMKDSDGNERYLPDPHANTDFVTMANKPIQEYAKQKTQQEIYPLVMTQKSGTRKELILGNKYAMSSSNTPYYPLDENGNEYTLDFPKQTVVNESNYLPIGYPVTNDNRIILPDWNGKPYISKTLLPKASEKDVVGKIYREHNGYTDHLTKLDSQRKSRSNTKKYQVQNNSQQRISFTLIVMIVLVLISASVLMFHK